MVIWNELDIKSSMHESSVSRVIWSKVPTRSAGFGQLQRKTCACEHVVGIVECSSYEAKQLSLLVFVAAMWPANSCESHVPDTRAYMCSDRHGTWLTANLASGVRRNSHWLYRQVAATDAQGPGTIDIISGSRRDPSRDPGK